MTIFDDMTRNTLELQELVRSLCHDYERAFLKDVRTQLQQLQATLDRHLENLPPDDTVVDFNPCRIHITGKIIKY